MRRCLAFALLALLLPAHAAPPAAAGRWQGQADIPGSALPLVVDLQGGDGQAWTGSVILPGRAVKGAPLADIRVDAQGLRFSLAAAFGGDSASAPTWADLRWQPDGRLAGTFHQGGHQAPLSLQRSGAAQVELPPPAPPLSPEILGTWRGRYQLGGYPREVTLTLSRQPGSAGSGELVIVGRRRSVLAIDQVRQGRQFIVLRSSQGGLSIEGRWLPAEGRIDGHFLQGPFEVPLQLQRDPRGAAP